MWSSEGVSFVPLLLVLAVTGLQRADALPQTEDGAGHNRGRVSAQQQQQQQQAESPAPKPLEAPDSFGRQLREPRQRNLIEALDAMINAPYRGPVVTSMNAFLSRNTLSRPVRQSLRQQFRAAGGSSGPLVHQLNIQRPPGQRQLVGAPSNNGQRLDVRPPRLRQGISGPLGQGQQFANSQGQGQRFNTQRLPVSDTQRLRSHFPAVQDQPPSRFSNQNSPQQQQQQRITRQSAQKLRSGQQSPSAQFPGFRSSPLQETGSALIEPGGSGFQPLTPHFQREDVKTAPETQRRELNDPIRQNERSETQRIEFDNPIRQIEKAVQKVSGASVTSSFSFENAVFNNKFESRRVKRDAQEYELISNAEGGYTVVPQTFGIHPHPNHDERDQSHESYSITRTIGNMISSWQQGFPEMLSDIRKMFSLDPASEEKVQSDEDVVVISSEPLPVPYLVPQLPAKLILPNAPSNHQNEVTQDYQVRIPRDHSPEGHSESKERLRREAQRGSNNKRIPNRPSIRGHPGQVRLPPARGQRIRQGTPVRAVHRPRPVRENPKPRPAPRPVRHGVRGQPIRVHKTQHRPLQHRPLQHRPLQHRPPQHRPPQHRPPQHRPVQHRPSQHRPSHHAPRETKPNISNVKTVSHPSKERPFPPTLAPESHFKLDDEKDFHHTEEVVEVNFADLPEEPSIEKGGRLKQIEDLIDLHNNEIKQYKETRKSRNDPGQSNPDRNQVVHSEIIIGNQQQDPGVQAHAQQNKDVHRFNPSSEKMKDAFKENFQEDFETTFGANFPQFPKFDFMTNFKTDFDDSFFGVNDISHSVETKAPAKPMSIKPTLKPFKPSPKIPHPSDRPLTHRPTVPVRHPNHLNTGPPHRFHHPRNPPHSAAPFLGPATTIFIPDGSRGGPKRHSVTAYVPGPAPLASILPSYSTVRAPAEVIRENLRIPRNTRQEDIVVVKKRDLDAVASNNDRLSGGFADSPLARSDSEGFMQDREPMPDFATLGGFGPMPEPKANAEESQFRPHFKMPAFEVPLLDMKQPTIGPKSFPKLKALGEDTGRRVRRSADAARPTFGRVAVPDSSASTTNTRPQQQQPLVPFDSFPVFNFPTFGERNSRELAPRAVSFSSSGRSASQQRPSQVVPTGPHSSSFSASSRPRSVEGHKPQVTQGPKRQSQPQQPQQPQRPQHDAIFKAEPQRIYPSFNSGRRPFSRPPPPPPATRSASNRTPFYPSPKVTNGPKGRGSSNSFNSLPNGFRDFHETFYGNSDRGELKGGRPGSSSHRQNDYAPVDNSLLGSGNFEVLSGGTFYEDEGYGNQRHPYDSFLDNGYNYNDGGGHFNQPHSNNYVDDFFSNFRDFSEFAVRRSDREERDDFFGHGSENINKYVTLSPVELKKINFQSDPKKPDVSNPSASASVAVAKKVVPDVTKPQPLDHPPRNIQEVMQQEDALNSNLEAAELSVDEKDPLIATF